MKKEMQKTIFIVLSLLFIWMPNIAFSESVSIVTCEISPFGFFTEDKKEAGILYEISNRIAEEAGFSYTNRIVPFARMIGELEFGGADFGIFLVSKENEKIAVKVVQIIPLENIVVGMKDTAFQSLSDLHNKTVAAVRGAKYDDAFTEDAAIKKYETRDYQQSITMLTNRRVDAMIGPSMGLFFTAKQMGFSQEVFGTPLVLNTKDAWLQYSKKTANENKIAALKAAAERLREKGVIQKIADKYLKGKNS